LPISLSSLNSPFTPWPLDLGIDFSPPQAPAPQGVNIVFDDVSNALVRADDKAMLQNWAASLAMPAMQTIDHFQPLSDIFGVDIQQAPIPTSPKRRSTSPVDSPHYAPLLKHYQSSLSALVSCQGDSETSPSAFAAFTTLAKTSTSSLTGQALHHSILAWAGRHMVNQGQVRYEAISEKLSEKALGIASKRLGETTVLGGLADSERLMLLATILMSMQFKVCRIRDRAEVDLSRRYQRIR
jgi:hypothetical protein